MYMYHNIARTPALNTLDQYSTTSRYTTALAVAVVPEEAQRAKRCQNTCID